MNDLGRSMTQSESKTAQIRLRLSHQSLRFIAEMKAVGVDGGDLVNLALSILEPRLQNIGATKDRIKEAVLLKSKIDY